MIGKKICYLGLALAISFFLFGCGGDGHSGSSSTGTGTVTMDITDAKPSLPLDVDQVIIRFDSVSVHKSGGGWLVLPLAQELQTPYEIDLLQFADGTTTEFVPPTPLLEGHYTQVRIEVDEAEMITPGGVHIPLVISSNDLKTDHQFDFQVEGGGAVHVVIDFDLSQSIVATGDDIYKLKPVLHLNETQEAATIRGKISPSSFGDSDAIVTVTWDTDRSGDLTGDDEVYTQVVVQKESDEDPTAFSIFWLVPDEGYHVLIQLEGRADYPEFVYRDDLDAGAIFWLNDSTPDPADEGEPI